MKQIKKIVFALAVLVLTFCSYKLEIKAAEIIIQDDADLLTDSEEQDLYIVMERVSEYGGVAFVSNPSSNDISSASEYAKNLCHGFFNGNSGTVLLIDMNNRRIEIFSTGAINKKINKHRANIIADNTYTYATSEDYYSCANEVYNEMLMVLEGGSITTPLKYLSNLLLAFGISVFAMYLILYAQRSKIKIDSNKATEDEVVSKAFQNVNITKKALVSRTKTKHVESSGGSSGGGYSGGGGGSSSGGSGGGHSF